MRRFNDMAEELAAHGVRVIALSKDTVAEASTHMQRDGIDRVTLLADPELTVIRQFGVEHHKAFGFDTGTFTIGGVPLGFTPSFKTMAIPTTLLVDERGVIRWIDQAGDYRIRSDNQRVFGAVKAAFPAAPGDG